jgi:monothiol glutaredoxin
MTDEIKQSIENDIKDHTILVYGKGTKSAPRCGFTHETIEFFSELGYPFEVIDALTDPEKREALSEMTNWPTLPKVFIAGKFYGDTDILAPMRESGELLGVLEDAFKTPA